MSNKNETSYVLAGAVLIFIALGFLISKTIRIERNIQLVEWRLLEFECLYTEDDNG